MLEVKKPFYLFNRFSRRNKLVCRNDFRGVMSSFYPRTTGSSLCRRESARRSPPTRQWRPKLVDITVQADTNKSCATRSHGRPDDIPETDNARFLQSRLPVARARAVYLKVLLLSARASC